MAGSEGHRKERMAREMLHFVFCFHFLQQILPCSASIESQGQAFIQTDNELKMYMDNGAPLEVMPGNHIPEMSIQPGGAPSLEVQFEPDILDFEEQPVGMPQMRQVTVQNSDTENSLHLLSISGSTLHFHCSFFQDKMVPPGGNTTFEVVFLARQEGNVENTLYIHTSKGSYQYNVFGKGIPNPYRIRPFLGAKVPVNSSFSPLLQLHNPHNSALQVQEVYSSGGDLHLELPTGEREATKDMWEIQPYETKPIMKASFVGRIESNHTAFIRIRTNKERKEEMLILPVEVEVTSAPGIYSPLEVVDFGILRTLDEPRVLRFSLLNSGPKPVHVTNITVHPPNPAISIDFRPVQLKPDILHASTVAFISYDASKATHPKQWSGRLIVKSKKNQYKVSIPYFAQVLHGTLGYDKNKTMFYTGDPNPKNITQDIPLTNTFNFTIVVYNITLPQDMKKYFTVEKFHQPASLQSQRTLTVFGLRFHPQGARLHLTTTLYLYTNASIFYIPLHVYNGKLKVVHHRPEIYKGQLDFGTLGVEERRNMTFTLRNDNPVSISINSFKANMAQTTVVLLGVEKGNGTTLTHSHNTSQIEISPLVLHPYHYAVFSVNLHAPAHEGSFGAEVLIGTQFENLHIPMTLMTATGSLSSVPDKIVLDNCFPGRICTADLRVHSSFKQYMEVRTVLFSPNDTRFSYTPHKDKPIPIEIKQNNLIGKIHFDPQKECKEDCYVGLSTYITAGHLWLEGLSLDKEVADTDQYLYTRFQQKWEALGSQTSTVNVTMQLDTNKVRGFLFPVQAHLHWPLLTRKNHIQFPLTQIGNMSVSDIELENPADTPVVVQVLPLSVYPNPHTLLELLATSVSSDLSEVLDSDDSETFTLYDLQHPATTPSSTLTAPEPPGSGGGGGGGGRGRVQTVEQALGFTPHKHTVSMVLAGGARERVRIAFHPKDDSPKMSLIIIRNNLTIVDTVVVQGQGGRGEIKFGNKRPGSQKPLEFKITEKFLHSCDKKRQTKSTPPNFTVKKTFTAVNSGQLEFWIQGFSINESPCEGYGFKVLDCNGFKLSPDSSKKVDVVFTPDFTMSRIRRTLTIFTSLGSPINYTLQAIVPAHMLTKCASALPRPNWEPILYYSIICIMSFLLFCIVVAAYYEADRIFHADILRRRPKVSSGTQTFERGKVFDLRTIAGVRMTPEQLASLASHGMKARCGNYNNGGAPIRNGQACVHDLSNGQLDPGTASNSPPWLTHPSHFRRRREGSSWRTWIWGILWPWGKAANSEGGPIVYSQQSSQESRPSPSPTPPPIAKVTSNGNNNLPPSLQPPLGISGPNFRQQPATVFSPSVQSRNLAQHTPKDCRPLTSTNMSQMSASPAILETRQEIKVKTTKKHSGNKQPYFLIRLISSLYTYVTSSSLSSSSSTKKHPKNATTKDISEDLILSDSPNSSTGMTDKKGVKDTSQRRPTSMNAGNSESQKTPKLGLSRRDKQLAGYDLPEPSLVHADEEEEETYKKEGKKRRRVPKLAERYRTRERIIDLDRDDTSSTTTESSSLEADEKVNESFPLRDMTPDPQVSSASSKISSSSSHHKMKKRGKKERKTSHTPDEQDNDEGFQVSSKSKTHKNIKLDPKDSFGGDILNASTLELPYRTKLEAAEAKEGRDSRSLTPDFPTNRLRKNKTAKNKLKGDNSRPHRPLSLPVGTPWPSVDEPTPDWFLSSPAQKPGNLGELSLQTQQFAACHGSNSPNGGKDGSGSGTGGKGALLGLNEPLSASSRSSSYSSVVSSGSGNNGNNKYGNKLSSSSGKGSPGQLYPDLKSPGAVGTHTAVPSGGSRKQSAPGAPWTLANATSPLTPVPLGPNSFGLLPIQESGPRQAPLLFGSGLEPLAGETYPNTSSGGSGDMWQNDSAMSSGSMGMTPGYDQSAVAPPSAPGQPRTMMQSLQEERRQRLIKYQQRLAGGVTGWPGFESNPPPEMPSSSQSLWDTSTAPTPGTWSTITDSPQRTPMTNSAALWESNPSRPSSASPSGWGEPNAPSVWADPADSLMHPQQQYMDPSQMPPGTQLYNPNMTMVTEPAEVHPQISADMAAMSSVNQQEGGVSFGGFDPFNLSLGLSSIWNTSGAPNNSAGWGTNSKGDPADQ